MQLNVADFIKEAIQEAERIVGVGVCVSDTTQKVIPIPHISLRWLLSANGWPLGRFTIGAGPQKCFKSAFLYELCGYFLDAGGVCFINDTESKISIPFMNSIIYRDRVNEHRVNVFQPETINAYQQIISALIRKFEKTPPNMPVLMGVDSLVGAGSKESIDGVKELGEGAGRGYSDAPIIIKNFLQSVSTMFKFPVCIHAVNHEKERMGGHGKTTPGGDAPGFYATLDLRFAPSRAGSKFSTKSEIDRGGAEGRVVRITNRKGCLGSDIAKELNVALMWTYERSGDLFEQKSFWDWEAATSALLEERQAQLAWIFGLEDSGRKEKSSIIMKERTTVHGDCYWSEPFGVAEGEKMPASEFGTYIQNHEHRQKIEDSLHISQYPIWEPTQESETTKAKRGRPSKADSAAEDA